MRGRMVVGGAGPAAAGAAAAAAGRGAGRVVGAGRGGFSLGAGRGVGGGVGAPAPMGGPAATGAVGAAALALQDDGPGGAAAIAAAARDTAARRRADAMLEELGALQRDLLLAPGGAGADPAPLRRLAALRADPEDGADPGLREAVRAIALRAAIELARRGVPDSASAP